MVPDRQEFFLELSDPDATLRLLKPDETERFRARIAEAVSRAGRKRAFYGPGERPASEFEPSEGGLSKILNGRVRNPGIFTVRSIATATGTTVGQLLGEEPLELPAAVREFAQRCAAVFDLEAVSDAEQREILRTFEFLLRKVEEAAELRLPRRGPADDRPAVPLEISGAFTPGPEIERPSPTPRRRAKKTPPA